MARDSHDVAVIGALSDRLIVQRMSGTEELGRLYEYAIELLGSDESLPFPDVLGKNLTLRLSLPDGGERYFGGVVTRFTQLGRNGRYALFKAEVRPWLWYLTRCSDCRIFQTKTVPDIVQAILKEHGYSDVEDKLSGTYRSWEYCVQYRESDFNFISRLLEQEGIYYYFRHEQDKQVLVLADDESAHTAPAGYEEIPYYPPDNEARRKRDHISDWLLSQEVQSELYALRDFDFEKPRANLEAKKTILREHGAGSFEAYDYPGEYTRPSDGSNYARLRIEEEQARFEQVRGSGNVRGLGAGALFRLQGYPRDDQNREYLVTGANFELQANPLETRTAGQGTSFTCALTAMDSQQPFRPARTSRKSVVQGPQTAIVVGPSGKDVWTDEYGRAKIQFHWDREGRRDENSSCWVRVSQTAAGKNWGGMFLPHIGQEVIVDFLEGDPDRPVITGRVYNADNMPPLELPEHRYHSVIRDHYGNEIVMDGTPGEEHMALYSPSHLSKVIIGKSFEQVTNSDELQKTYGNSLKLIVGNVVSGTMGAKLYWTIGTSATVVAGNSETVTGGADLSVFVGAKASFSAAPELAVNLTPKVSIGWAREYKHTKGDYTRTSKSDIVHDSKKNVVISGGPTGMTIIQSSDAEAFMASGTPKPRGAKDAAAIVLATKAAAAALLSAGASTALMEISLADLESADKSYVDPKTKKKKEHVVDGWAHLAPELVGASVVGGLGLAATIAFLLACIKTVEDTPKPEHTTENAKVSVKNELVHIFAGMAPTNSEIKVEPKGVTISAPKYIYLEANNNVNISKLAMFMKSSKTINIKATVKHKNITVLG